MPPLYAFSLGPMHTNTGPGTLFIGVLDGKILPPAQETSPGAALHELRQRVPPGTPLLCVPELAQAGLPVGFSPAPLSAEVAFMRACLAISLAHGPNGPDPRADLGPFLVASARFWSARPWERISGDDPVSVTLTTGRRQVWEGSVMGAAGEEFGVALYSRPGSIAAIQKAMAQGHPERMPVFDMISATFDADPAFAVHAVAAVCALPRVPLLLALKEGKPRGASHEDVRLLTAALEALANLEDGERVCRAELPELGISAEISLDPPQAVMRSKGRRR